MRLPLKITVNNMWGKNTHDVMAELDIGPRKRIHKVVVQELMLHHRLITLILKFNNKGILTGVELEHPRGRR